jgi:hypothetical protein
MVFFLPIYTLHIHCHPYSIFKRCPTIEHQIFSYWAPLFVFLGGGAAAAFSNA